MTHSVVRTTDVGMYDNVREYTRRRTALFGLLAWNEVVMTTTPGTELRIICHEIPGKIFLNGEELVPKVAPQ